MAEVAEVAVVAVVLEAVVLAVLEAARFEATGSEAAVMGVVGYYH